jgi:hypothetical protein
MSIRNGTAAAILLSIAFVLVAVATRDALPGLAGNEGPSSSTVSIDQANVSSSSDTSSTSQIGQQANFGSGATPSTEADAWNDDAAGSDSDDEHEDHDESDDDEHRSNDHDDDRYEDHEEDDDDDD